MNIILIGGNGFVGKALIKELKKYKVKINYLSRSQNHSISKEEATWIQGDIFDIENIVINEKYDIAIHLIGTIKNKNLYSKLNYLIVRPGLMYGKDRLTSYFNILPIKLFSKLGITFFKNVYPLPVEKVAKSVVKAILDNTNSTIIEIKDIK